MFNGMMDPELIKLAQEQMSRMSPADFARIQQQMMANPDLMKMAAESMNNMRPEDLKHAAEQLKHTRPEEMAEISDKMANLTPEELATMSAHVDAQIAYEFNAAELLKKQGNELHSQGQFDDALQKYRLAKTIVKRVSSSKGKALWLACSLNLMSCYLKTRQYHECITEGSEVLTYEPKNVKALYRRGQAYKELGQFQDAVRDLSKAHEISPDDETIANVLRDAKERLGYGDGEDGPKGVVIEEITEGVTESSGNNESSLSNDPQSRLQETNYSSSGQTAFQNGAVTNSEKFQALKDDPEAVRTFQDFVSKTNPETLSALSFGKSGGGLSPEMAKTASDMISKMSPQEVQKMLELASSFPGENPCINGGSLGPSYDSSNVTPGMLKKATDMMKNMSPKDLESMVEMASLLRREETPQKAAAESNSRLSADTASKFSRRSESSVGKTNTVGETSSSRGISQKSRSTTSGPSIPVSTADLQEQMRNQMNDPAMRQIFTSMMQNMSPDTMAEMSKQFGLNLSSEDAARAQQAMSSLSPEHLDRMMRWADRIQRGVEGAKKTKNWLLGKPGMILAICMLILAIILHWLGFIGL